MQNLKKAAELIHALFSPSSTDDEDNRIICELKAIVPDPRITDHIFYSHKYLNSDGSLDVDRLLDDCFKYKSDVIAL